MFLEIIILGLMTFFFHWVFCLTKRPLFLLFLLYKVMVMITIIIIIIICYCFRVQLNIKLMMISHKSWRSLEAWQIVHPSGRAYQTSSVPTNLIHSHVVNYSWLDIVIAYLYIQNVLYLIPLLKNVIIFIVGGKWKCFTVKELQLSVQQKPFLVWSNNYYYY